MKMIAIAPHHLIYTYLIYPVRLSDIVKVVWAIVLSVPKGNARSPRNRIRQIQFPHLFYLLIFPKGTGKVKFI